MAAKNDIHHVLITMPTGAEEEAHRFYCSVLGLQEIEKQGRLTGRGGLWAQAGDRQVLHARGPLTGGATGHLRLRQGACTKAKPPKVRAAGACVKRSLP